MSVLQEYENCVYISHNKYIEKVYEQLDNAPGSYKLNKNLFNINIPFKKQTLKRKHTDETDDTFEEIKKEIKYISEKYTRFYKKLVSESVFVQNNLKQTELNNVEALETSQQLFNESGINLTSNAEGGNIKKSVLVQLDGNEYLFPNNCNFFCKDVKDISKHLFNLDKYDLIVLDPPWWNKAVRRKRAKNNHGYQMMRNEDLKDLPIETILNTNGIVVLWCTNSRQHIQACNEFFQKWGVKLVAKWFWLKIAKTGEPIVNFSEPPAKLPFERILIAARNDDGKNLGLRDSDGKILISVPSALHSHKPPLLEILEPYMSAGGRSLEVFARYLLPNCTSYGLEALRFQHISLYEHCVPK